MNMKSVKQKPSIVLGLSCLFMTAQISIIKTSKGMVLHVSSFVDNSFIVLK